MINRNYDFRFVVCNLDFVVVDFYNFFWICVHANIINQTFKFSTIYLGYNMSNKCKISKKERNILYVFTLI